MACKPPPKKPFLDQRGAHPTRLTVHGPSPQPYENEEPPAGAESVLYPSGPLKLEAWLALPPGAKEGSRLPAVVYFHGGFAFGAGDFDDARPFRDRGFVLMMPMLRGENGNPGDHEMYWGELDDARAAVRWLAQRPEVDPTRVYTFGHSAGGVISALLSLCPEPALRQTGSAGGLYDESLFDGMRGLPFDAGDRDERRLRVFSPNAALMLQRHVGFVGSGDEPVVSGAATARRAASGGLLEVVELPGDHFSSLPAAAGRFAERIALDAKPVR